MTSGDRRSAIRVAFSGFLNQYIRDEPVRALVTSLSPTGVLINQVALPPPHATQSAAREERHVGLEIDLPGTSETIWARGEICYQKRDHFVWKRGIRFDGIPKVYSALLRDYCQAVHETYLAKLLRPLRRNV